MKFLETWDPGAVTACADLAGRTGARGFELGYLHDDPADPGWYAHVQYKGTRLTVEGFTRPEQACDALAERLLAGAQCQHCGSLVTTSAAGALAQDATLLNGVTWTKEEQAAAGLCCWRREGPAWLRGCG